MGRRFGPRRMKLEMRMGLPLLCGHAERFLATKWWRQRPAGVTSVYPARSGRFLRDAVEFPLLASDAIRRAGVMAERRTSEARFDCSAKRAGD